MIGNAPSTPATTSEEAPASPGALAVRGGQIRAALVPVLALLTALVFCALLLLLNGRNPFSVYGVLWQGAVSGPAAIANTLVQATPYILLGLAVAVGFKGGLFNIGAEGQYIVGAIGAAWAGQLTVGLPAILLVAFVLLAGALFGSLYAAIAGVLKVVSGAHEVITTIMLNYVAADLVQWLVNEGGPLNANPSQTQSNPVAVGARLPIIAPGTPLHAGLIVALLGAVAVYVLVWRTTWGFQLRAVGLNPQAARSAGISVRRVTVWVMCVSGALAGLAGAITITGLQPYYLPNTIGSGYGYDAIAVAIIGAGNPLGIVLSALLLGALRSSATVMEAQAGISAPFVSVIEAAILFFVAAPVVIRWIYFRWTRTRAGIGVKEGGV